MRGKERESALLHACIAGGGWNGTPKIYCNTTHIIISSLKSGHSIQNTQLSLILSESQCHLTLTFLYFTHFFGSTTITFSYISLIFTHKSHSKLLLHSLKSQKCSLESYIASGFTNLNTPFSMIGNLWLVKFNGLVLQPMACTNHKFPVKENGAFKWK